MQKEEVIKTVNEFLVEEIEIEENLLKEDALLKEGLGIDSLDFVDIVVIVEKKFGFKIEQKDITDAAEAYVTYQYAMYGLGNVPAEMIKDAVNNVLADRRQVENLVEQVEDRKVLDKIKETISLKATKITSAKFRELK